MADKEIFDEQINKAEDDSSESKPQSKIKDWSRFKKPIIFSTIFFPLLAVVSTGLFLTFYENKTQQVIPEKIFSSFEARKDYDKTMNQLQLMNIFEKNSDNIIDKETLEEFIILKDFPKNAIFTVQSTAYNSDTNLADIQVVADSQISDGKEVQKPFEINFSLVYNGDVSTKIILKNQTLNIIFEDFKTEIGYDEETKEATNFKEFFEVHNEAEGAKYFLDEIKTNNSKGIESRVVSIKVSASKTIDKTGETIAVPKDFDNFDLTLNFYTQYSITPGGGLSLDDRWLESEEGNEWEGDLFIPTKIGSVVVKSIDSEFASNVKDKLVSLKFESDSQIESIGNNAFQGCSNLDGEIELPNSLKTIGTSAFEDCTNLSGALIIPSDIEEISQNTFKGCSNITSVVLPNSLKTIGTSAFEDCTNLSGALTIPSSVEVISQNAFKNCSEVESITVSSNLYQEHNSIWSQGYWNNQKGASSNIKSSDGYFYEGKFKIDSNGNLSIADTSTWNYASWDGNLFIPDEVDGFDVIKLIPRSSKESFSFQIKDKLTSLSFDPNINLTSIDDKTFSDCKELKNVSFPVSLQSLGTRAFNMCSKLSNITFPEDSQLTTIGDYTFEDCTSLVTITLPSSLESIGNGAFSYCSKLTSITLPSSLTSIGTSAFEDCTSLETITLPSSLTSIGEKAFGYCNKLTSIIFPEDSKLEDIGNLAFISCTNLAGDLLIPSSVQSIGSEAFKNCDKRKLTSISVSSDLFKGHETTWSQGYWNNEIDYRSNVVEIGSDLMDGMWTISREGVLSITDISKWEFNKWDGNLVIPKSAANIEVKELFSGDSNNNFSTQIKDKLKSISFENGSKLTSIVDYAFADCTSLETIAFSESLTSIGNYAFSNCSSLTSITLWDSLEAIGNSAFNKCTSLGTITFPTEEASLASIGDAAFEGCIELLGDLTIPKSVNSIGSDAFKDCNKDKLRSISVSENLFENHETTWSQGYWNGATNADSNIINIDGDIVGNMFTLSKDGILSITDTAQWDYDNWEGHLTIPKAVGLRDVKEIKQSGVGDTFSTPIKDKLKSVTFEEGLQLTSIGERVFQDCTSLESIVFPMMLESIDAFAFSNCTSLKTIALPESIKSIGSESFKNCTTLETITIPESLTSIGLEAFKDCANLSGDLIIPSSTQSIGNSAFEGCVKLSSVSVSADLFQDHNSIWSQGYWDGKTNWESNVVNVDSDRVDGMWSISKEGILSITDISEWEYDEWGGELVIPKIVANIEVKELFQGKYGAAFSTQIKAKLTSLKFEEGLQLTSIGNYAFYECRLLAVVDPLPETLISIGDSAFKYCNKLTSIIIPELLESLGKSSFSYTGIVSFTLPKLVEEIKDNTFDDCRSLTTFIIPEDSKLTKIGNNAFFNCQLLTSITLPSLLTTIGDKTFNYCYRLTSITLPPLLTSIGLRIFDSCTKLESIYVSNEYQVGKTASLTTGNSAEIIKIFE
ncbi:MAG: leucine-rich repeat domain-containing protein [Mycoplasma sp.]